MGMFSDESDLKKTFVKVSELNIQTPDDRNFCCVNSIAVLTETEIIVLDVENWCVKLVNTFNKTVTSVSKFSAPPRTLSAVNSKLCVVSFPILQCVRFVAVSASGELTVQHDISVSEKSVGMTCVNDKLYMSFLNPVRFEILDLNGHSRSTVYLKPDVSEICRVPRKFTVNSDETLIFVTDSDTNSVFTIDMSGKKKAAYRGALDNPKGIALSTDNFVYVCDRNNNSVYCMQPNLRDCCKIIGYEEEFVLPYAVCINSKKNILYVSTTGPSAKSHNFVSVYREIVRNANRKSIRK